ncbi:transcriptional regulator GcvA [Jiella sonneratiae]|uniref:Transcriptional regulator GcvA n=1 Tax=Jiella sonneratiae TaxID=2816856 RepID=A0ABS3J9L2_9HYPH|nr:transcriptional regulator GcvA [Jiella sonneratiae]MBO0906357.1 transcriptional regulator GcvA [Jiella sonneratiae]
MRHRDLPPLAAIRAFEAAARHLSFTRAGEELGMTQAAVSYQIKLLEERLGAPLFLRRTRAVELTPAGRRLAPAASDALDRLADAFAAARSDAGGLLSISVLPTFAAHFLAPRIGRFQIRHPAIAVRTRATRDLADFQRDEVDVAIRSGLGDWPGLEVHPLFPVDFTPMLSPKLAGTKGPLETPADLLRLILIDPGDRWWPLWFDAMGVEGFEPTAHPDTRMGDQHLEARAAIGGHGVAILTPAFYREEIAAGMLVQPFPAAAEEGQFYFLVYPSARRNVPKIRAFRDWLLEEVRSDEAEFAPVSAGPQRRVPIARPPAAADTPAGRRRGE